LQSPWACLSLDTPSINITPIPTSSIADIPFQKTIYTSPLLYYTNTTLLPPLLLYYYHHHHHHHHHHNNNNNMSSPATQYVYIPNLVGRQMLRVPLEDVDVDDIASYTPASSQTTSTTPSSPPPFTRTVSRSPSISSVESTE
jgi:hypothetical protein